MGQGGVIQVFSGNSILRNLPPATLALIVPHLEPVALPVRTKLAEVGKAARWVYFPESGIASIVSQRAKNWQEVGIFGREGFGCHSVLLGCSTAPFTILMQIAGQGRRIAADRLLAAAETDATLQITLLRYVHTFIIQLSQTAVANVQCNITQRLARWLLMIQDRIGVVPITITHEFLAGMLGVGRTGVTLALQELELAGMIGTARKQVTILDRPALERMTEGYYGFAEAEYRRVLTPSSKEAPAAMLRA